MSKKKYNKLKKNKYITQKGGDDSCPVKDKYPTENDLKCFDPSDPKGFKNMSLLIHPDKNPGCEDYSKNLFQKLGECPRNVSNNKNPILDNNIQLQLMNKSSWSNLIKDGYKKMFIISFVLLITLTAIQLILRKTTKKDNSASYVVQIICGIGISICFVFVMISVNWSAIGSKIKSSTNLQQGVQKREVGICFDDYVSNYKFFYTGLAIGFIGFIVPPLWKYIRVTLMKKENNIPKSVAAIMNLMMALGIGLIILGLNFSITSKLNASKYLTWTTFLIVLGISIIVLGVYGYCVAIKHKKQLQQNWPNYKCKPYVIPIAGWIGPPGTSTVENMGSCVKTMAKELFDVFLHPWITLFDLFKDILRDITMDIQDLRKMIYYIRSVIKNGLVSVANKTYDAYYRIAVLFKTIKNLLLSIFYVIRALLYVLDYAFNTLASLWNGPIGGVARFFCFDPSTPISLYNNSKKSIYTISVGDKLMGGGTVTAVIKVKKGASKMFNYNGIIVAGTHLIYELGSWKRVDETILGEEIEYNGEWLYCLAVDNNKIWINNILFADYFEANDYNLNKNIQQIILSKLNGYMVELPIDENYTLGWGFDHNTFYRIINSDNIIDGYVVIQPIGDVCRMKNGIICSADQIVLDKDDEWKRAKEVKGSEIISWTDKLYSVCTNDGKIKIDGWCFTDFEQIMDQDVNHQIDHMVSEFRMKNSF